MKFLHLADLHLGKRVNGFDMLEDQRFILEQILTLCEKHGVEAVVIAGDIYDTPVPPAAACTLLDWFLTQLAARRIPVLAVSGNHDSAERLDFASSLLAEQNVHIAGRFTGCPKQVVLNDRHGPIEFTLLPFVRAATVRHYLPDADITDYDSAVGAALAVCEPPPRAGCSSPTRWWSPASAAAALRQRDRAPDRRHGGFHRCSAVCGLLLCGARPYPPRPARRHRRRALRGCAALLPSGRVRDAEIRHPRAGRASAAWKKSSSCR